MTSTPTPPGNVFAKGTGPPPGAGPAPCLSVSQKTPSAHVPSAWLCLVACSFLIRLGAAEVDESQLPAAAAVKVDFDRDIKPIFEAVCFRCHGAERPKSKFSLATRESALKGGANGIDIIAGQSAKSPLIHYVARLVEDMEMPPPGKGDPLSQEKISLLRAWIDQGVPWSTSESAGDKRPEFSISPSIQWISVSGNERKFREHYWMKEGWSGGVADFHLKEKLGQDLSVTTDGRILGDQNDYRVAVTLEKKEVGFARFGIEQFRKYFDDVGGYYPPFNPTSFSLNRDLHMDLGRAWVEFGLTRPDWPRAVIGYEYQFRDGSKSLLEWGDVTDAPFELTNATKNIFPAYKDLSERVHILKLDLSHEIAGVFLEDNLRVEFFDLDTSRYSVVGVQLKPPAPENVVLTREGYDHFQAANTFRAERHLTDWLFASGGYLYSHLEGDGFFKIDFLSPGQSSRGPVSDHILLDRDSHVFNFNTLLGPWRGLSFSGGVQTEWTRQRGFGRVRDEFDPNLFMTLPIADFDANLDRVTVEESFGLRYTQIPFTVLYVDTRFQQEKIGQSEDGLDVTGGTQVLLRDTDATSDLKDVRAGFSVSPWQRASFTANYRHRVKASDYDHRVDQAPAGTPGNGYSAFIRARDIESDEVEAKLVLKPISWLKTTLSYQFLTTDFTTVTDPSQVSDVDSSGNPITLIYPGGGILAGNYDAHVYSLNATLTPWRRIYLSATFSYRDTRTTTAHNDVPSVAPYRGDIYSALASANYVVNQATDLHANYSFSRADYGQNNTSGGLPLGIVYDWHGMQVGVNRRIKKNLITNFQYGYYVYDEPSAGQADNYTAHALFASVTLRLP